VITGKLSDAAGLFVFPILLLSVVEVLMRALRLRWQATLSAAAIACATSAVGFTLVKSVPSVALAYGEVIGLLRWPIFALTSVAQGEVVESPVPIDVVVDGTDLVTLVFVGLSYAYMRSRIMRSDPAARPQDGRLWSGGDHNPPG
ncbi:MAG: hypothetical protein WA988_06980, partial [Candidatus Nanopelagicales bacterium]